MPEDAYTVHRKSGFAGEAQWRRRPALVVVDFSLGFTDPQTAIGSDLSEILDRTNDAVGVFRSAGLPIVFTTIEFRPEMNYAWHDKAPGLKILEKGSDLVRIDPASGYRSGDPVVSKSGASAFFGTDLTTLLQAVDADTVILAGVTTSGCVRASAVDAVQYGYPTVVLRDCVGDRHPSVHESSLSDIEAKYGDVRTLNETIGRLQLPFAASAANTSA